MVTTALKNQLGTSVRSSGTADMSAETSRLLFSCQRCRMPGAFSEGNNSFSSCYQLCARGTSTDLESARNNSVLQRTLAPSRVLAFFSPMGVT